MSQYVFGRDELDGMVVLDIKNLSLMSNVTSAAD